MKAQIGSRRMFELEPSKRLSGYPISSLVRPAKKFNYYQDVDYDGSTQLAILILSLSWKRHLKICYEFLQMVLPKFIVSIHPSLWIFMVSLIYKRWSYIPIFWYKSFPSTLKHIHYIFNVKSVKCIDMAGKYACSSLPGLCGELGTM